MLNHCLHYFELKVEIPFKLCRKNLIKEDGQSIHPEDEGTDNTYLKKYSEKIDPSS